MIETHLALDAWIIYKTYDSQPTITTHLVFEKGMAYRKVGSRALEACMAGLPDVWSSLQSMNSMVSRSKGCDSTSASSRLSNPGRGGGERGGL